MLTGQFKGDNRPPAAITLSAESFGPYPMSNGITRLETRFIGEPPGDDGQRVLFTIEGAHFFMHTLHETVKVGTHLLFERQRIKERIDQVSFTPAHTAPEIQPLDRSLFFFAEQLAEQARLALRRGNQIVVQTLQMAYSVFLRGIVEEVRAFQISLISF